MTATLLHVFAGCCIALIGCGHTVSHQRLADAEAEWVTIANKHSLKEIDRALASNMKSESRNIHAQALIQGWGKHGSWFDLIVVKFIDGYSPCKYHDDYNLRYADLLRLIQNRITEQAELRHHFAWYLTWKSGPVGLVELCQRQRVMLFHHCDVQGDSLRPFMYVDGLIDDADVNAVFMHSTWDSLDQRWHIAKLEFLSNQPFLRYDKSRHVFVVDEAARHDGLYLKPEEQQRTAVPTPLPNWTGPLPERSGAISTIRPRPTLE